MKVLIAGGGTGGHLMPALALAQALQDAGKGIEPVLVGAERGIEAQVLPRYPFRHHLLPMEPIYRRTWWNNVRALVTAGRAWRAVGRVLDAEQPVIVVGTGGYAAGPVVWRAQQRGLPTVLQEQNAFPAWRRAGSRGARGRSIWDFPKRASACASVRARPCSRSATRSACPSRGVATPHWWSSGSSPPVPRCSCSAAARAHGRSTTRSRARSSAGCSMK